MQIVPKKREGTRTAAAGGCGRPGMWWTAAHAGGSVGVTAVVERGGERDN
jgi:hypothetical protein